MKKDLGEEKETQHSANEGKKKGRTSFDVNVSKTNHV